MHNEGYATSANHFRPLLKENHILFDMQKEKGRVHLSVSKHITLTLQTTQVGDLAHYHTFCQVYSNSFQV